MKYLIVSEKSWNAELISSLAQKKAAEWLFIDKKELFTLNNIKQLNPSKIFIPHWSYIIPSEIFEHYECIVFHMTDLPYGRGGSPLQNLIVRGFDHTKISALKVTHELDGGDIYLKKDLALYGSAREIFERANHVIESMIIDITEKNIQPVPQTGEPYIFKRRKPEEGNITNLTRSKEVFDYIRMLDADGYPPAFIETPAFKFEFTNASLNSDQTITAHVRIIKK